MHTFPPLRTLPRKLPGRGVFARVWRHALLAAVMFGPPAGLVAWAWDPYRLLATPPWLVFVWAGGAALWLFSAALTYVPSLGRIFARLSPGTRAGDNRVGLVTFTRTKREIGVHVAGIGDPYVGLTSARILVSFRGAARKVRHWLDTGAEPADKPVVVDTWVDGYGLFEAGLLLRMKFRAVGPSPPAAWGVWLVSLFVHVAPGCRARGDFAPLRKWVRGPRRRQTTVAMVAAAAPACKVPSCKVPSGGQQ